MGYSMRVARGSQPPPSSSQLQSLGLKLVLCEGIIALKILKFSDAWWRNQKPSERFSFWPFFAEKRRCYWPKIRKYMYIMMDILRFFNKALI